MEHYRLIRRALLSVFNKDGIIEFAQALSARGIDLICTSGTACLLKKAGLIVTKISDYIQFPEIMEGKIKTLHPKIFGGILGHRNRDCNIMNNYGILPIDMVIINFYPFSKTTVNQHKKFSIEDIIKNIDIGGPTIVRSAAKNYKDVAVVTNNNDYDLLIKEMDDNNGSLTLETRLLLAIKAFKYVTTYDDVISDYFLDLMPVDHHYRRKNFNNYFPKILKLNFVKKQDMRYGENRHQKAAFYIKKNLKGASVSTAKQLQGKTLSYNNITDANTALECVKEFEEPACVIVKHENPCGVALGNSILKAYHRAYKADQVSAFGGIIAFNRELDVHTAQAIISQQFVEVIIAPFISKEALKIISFKPNIRVLACGQWCNKSILEFNFKSINGGLLVQDQDINMIALKDLQIVSQRQPDKQEINDALFSWKVAKFVKSNAIVFAKKNVTIAIGAGQMSRVFSMKIANLKIKEMKLKEKKFVMASDAFFSFRDNIDNAIGVTCIIQPGGSIKDNEIIDEANQRNIAMIFTYTRHFRH